MLTSSPVTFARRHWVRVALTVVALLLGGAGFIVFQLGQQDRRIAEKTVTKCDLIEVLTPRGPTSAERAQCADERTAGGGLMATGGVMMGAAGVILGLGFGVSTTRHYRPSNDLT